MALGVLAPAAVAAEVRVEVEGGSAETVTLGDPDIRDRYYTLPGADGSAPLTGSSLEAVLREAGVDPYDHGGAVVTGGGTTIELDREETLGADSFPEGPPLLWADGAGVSFLRPAGDDGSPPELASGAIAIRMLERGTLRVEASASSTRLDAGGTVTFSATVSGAGGEPVELDWYFDDGSSVSGARVTHRFRRAGTYDVVVGVTTASDSRGDEDIVTVRVGKPPEDGPDRRGGGAADDAASDSGAVSGGSGGASGASGGAGPSSAERGPERASRPDRPRSPSREKPLRGAPSGGTERVTGTELAGLSVLDSPAAADAVRAARSGRPDEDDTPIPAAVWWATATLALLGLGGWLEARRPRERRPA
jgi:PKD domain-containing protein